MLSLIWEGLSQLLPPSYYECLTIRRLLRYLKHTNHGVIHVVSTIYHGLSEAGLHHIDHAFLRVQHRDCPLVAVGVTAEAALTVLAGCGCAGLAGTLLHPH